MKLWIIVPFLAVLIGLAGCQTPQQREAAYLQTCQNEGYRDGSQAMAICTASLRQQDEARAEAFSNALLNISAQMQAQQAAAAAQQRQMLNNRVQCTSQTIGNEVITNCH